MSSRAGRGRRDGPASSSIARRPLTLASYLDRHMTSSGRRNVYILSRRLRSLPRVKLANLLPIKRAAAVCLDNALLGGERNRARGRRRAGDDGAIGKGRRRTSDVGLSRTKYASLLRRNAD